MAQSRKPHNKISPIITFMDPIGLGLTYGEYHLRAVATDLGGKADASPSFITVTYTDLTAPDAPKELKGSDPMVETSHSHGQLIQGGDLDGYNIYRTTVEVQGRRVNVPHHQRKQPIRIKAFQMVSILMRSLQ